MKHIALAALFGAVVAINAFPGAAHAADDFATRTFEQQALYGENLATTIFEEQSLYGENVDTGHAFGFDGRGE